MSGDVTERVKSLMRIAEALGDLRRLGVPETVLSPIREWTGLEAGDITRALTAAQPGDGGDAAAGEA